MTNEEECERVEQKRQLINLIREPHAGWIGRVVCNESHIFLKRESRVGDHEEH